MMKELKLDGMLLTHPPDVEWLSNFTGEDSIGLFTDKDFHLITDFRYKQQAEQEAGWLKVAIREGKMVDTLSKVVHDSKAKRVGFEANFTTFGQITALDHALKDLAKSNTNHEPELVPLEDV